MEGRPQLRLGDGALAEYPKGAERRTGRVEPISTLGRCAGVLEGPRNLKRACESRCKAGDAFTRSLKTLEDRNENVDQLLRHASLARSAGNRAPGPFSFWAAALARVPALR